MALHAIMNAVIGVFRLYLFITSTFHRPEPRPELSPNPDFYQSQINNLNRLVRGNEVDCHEQLRVNRRTFFRLCCLVRGVGLGDSRFVCLEERVAIFLFVLAHHTKQRRTKYDFYRSIETISRHFHAVLQAVLRLHRMLLATPEPVPANYHDTRWNWFQNTSTFLNACAVMATNEVEVVDVERPSKLKRRSWRKVEEDALMKCMLNEEGKWKSENGFRTGYFTHLQKELQKVLPGCTLQANPHIDSKVKHWKSIWAKLVDIINLSGFGWDAVNNRIDVDQSVWDAYEKAHGKKAQGLYGKSFPYFEDWQTIFGKDRATGAGAEDYDDMARTEVANETAEPYNSNDFYEALFDEYNGNLPNTPTTPITPTTPSTPQPFTPHASLPTSTPRGSMPAANAGAQKGRKRTRMGEAELSIYASMDNYLKSTNVHVEKLANSFGYDKELSARRTMVKEELSKLNITLAEKFKLSAVIVSHEERVDDFYGTKPEERQALVEAILAGEVFVSSGNDEIRLSQMVEMVFCSVMVLQKTGQEHLDIIAFYNEIFIPVVKPLLVEVAPVGTCQKANRNADVNNNTDVHSSKSYYACVGESTLAYQSPSKDLTAINNRFNGNRKLRGTLNFDDVDVGLVSGSLVANSLYLHNGSCASSAIFCTYCCEFETGAAAALVHYHLCMCVCGEVLASAVLFCSVMVLQLCSVMVQQFCLSPYRLHNYVGGYDDIFLRLMFESLNCTCTLFMTINGGDDEIVLSQWHPFTLLDTGPVWMGDSVIVSVGVTALSFVQHSCILCPSSAYMFSALSSFHHVVAHLSSLCSVVVL
ncbi:hypothetical protein RHMOL_Rhmol01G0308900 [Rhododendron molle]|uniref:Uncharacterized protein n=1 Tax=Rhododendron molle TaxID=49168 RepID=A0ACC0Q936_RHOML|nr:hypothetical protein RHMOL_Rhmol01G0308900 [Rhododendron molle]